ncbi:MAG: hypothetical protein M5R40_03520 [Anaerolineae bacterium]|nr:hypothetical protein [Anaerolineae bacterium]
MPLATLLFWAWQRWELEVCHRELKANFGLGDKQCWNPIAAVASVQWSAWVYALLLLAGYRTWGLSTAPPVPTRWWRGASRWSLNTLWRAFRATVWGDHDFRPLCALTTDDWGEKRGPAPGLTQRRLRFRPRLRRFAPFSGLYLQQRPLSPPHRPLQTAKVQGQGMPCPY